MGLVIIALRFNYKCCINYDSSLRTLQKKKEQKLWNEVRYVTKPNRVGTRYVK